MVRSGARASRWSCFAAGLAGLGWFLFLGGGRILNPLTIDWITGDWMQHWLGFLFFKRDPWTFPLGTISSWPHPLGTSIGFTDSNPLIAIALKPFAHLLPDEFQFIGLWLFLCFGLQGVFGALLSSVVTRQPIQQFVGGVLFAMSPVLAGRVGHDTLSAHWLILAVLYFGLRTYRDGDDAKRSVKWLMGLVCLSAMIHPYLTAICFALTLACLWRFVRAGFLRMPEAALRVTAMVAVTAGLFWAIGYFSEAETARGGFGVFSTDLLAIFDADNTSRLIGNLPTRPGQWEGFAFPGLGGWILIALTTWWMFRRPAIDWQHRKTIVWAAVVLAVYAVSSDITVAGHLVARVRRFYSFFEPVPSTFRASGRFIWPIYYVGLLYGIWGVCRFSAQMWKGAATVILVFAVAVQASDFAMSPYWFMSKVLRQPNRETFEIARGQYDHLVLFPPQIGLGCRFEPLEPDEEFVYRYALLAYRIGLSFNSGLFARTAQTKADEYCDAMIKQVQSGVLDSRSLYIVSPDYIDMVKAASAVCNRSDGDWVCVGPDSSEPFRRFLETGRPPKKK